MLGRAVGIAVTYALGASAFLIPAGIATTSDLSTSIVNPKEQVITLPCSECAFPPKQENVASADEEDNVYRIQGGANSVVLNFTVSDDGQKLQLNGRAIYPSVFAPFLLGPMYVKQVPSETGLVDIKSGHAQSTDLEVTAYGYEDKEHFSEDMDLSITLMLNIMGLENERVHLDEVAVHLLKTDDGELLIMMVESVPNQRPDAPYAWPADKSPHHGPPPHHKPAAECDVLPSALCKLKAIIDSKINGASSHAGSSPKKGGCRGRKGPPGTRLPTHIRPHLVRPDQDGRPPFHDGRPHHMRPHGPHHGHHDHDHDHDRTWNKWLFILNDTSSHSFFFVIVANIAVGMTAVLLDLIIIRLIIHFCLPHLPQPWPRLPQRGRGGSASDVTVMEDGESDGMLAKMEPPPVYEAAPTYGENKKEHA